MKTLDIELKMSCSKGQYNAYHWTERCRHICQAQLISI